jgi:hypothetical protein
MFCLRAWFIIICWPNDALNGIGKNEVGIIIEREKIADEGATVGSYNADLVYVGTMLVQHIFYLQGF